MKIFFEEHKNPHVALILFLFFITGCQSAPHKSRPSQAEAISALTTMTHGLTGLSAGHTVKYCPVDGQRFSADMIYCPIHHVKLKWVE